MCFRDCYHSMATLGIHSSPELLSAMCFTKKVRLFESTQASSMGKLSITCKKELIFNVCFRKLYPFLARHFMGEMQNRLSISPEFSGQTVTSLQPSLPGLGIQCNPDIHVFNFKFQKEIMPFDQAIYSMLPRIYLYVY